MIAWTLITIIVLMAIGLAAAYWMRSRTEREEATYYFRCPGCRRKLRYRTRQIGHQGKCPNCKQGVIFPPPATQPLKK